jgi:outer membrane immunogenic protein
MTKKWITGALITGAMLGALVAGSALAADLKPAPMLMKAPPMPAYSWTGCYFDGGVGYGKWDQDHSITTSAAGGPPNTFTTIETTNGGRGWLGRLGAGCDYQVSSSWVVGVFGDYDFMNLKGSMATLLTNLGSATAADEKESSAWAVGGRIGYLLAPSILTFVDGGYTRTRFDQMNVMRADGSFTGNAFPAHTYQGWFIGSGFEYAFTWLPINGLFVRSEYRYATYQKDDLMEFIAATGAPSGNSGLGNSLHSSKQVQTVTTSLVWRFNWH